MKRIQETEYQQWLRRKQHDYTMGVFDIMSRSFLVFPAIFVMAYYGFESALAAVITVVLSIPTAMALSYVTVRWTLNGERWSPISEDEYNRITQMYMGNDD